MERDEPDMNKKSIRLFTILLISALTHLWNPVGFPDLFYDEGIYMRRAMHTMQELNPQESYLYDHPYFGQIFLASVLKMINYPSSLARDEIDSMVRLLYEVPRILMGILAVIDTFLLFKIAEKRYDMNNAIIASLIFAVMPLTWLLRRILLDSIMLPFILGSILLSLYYKDSSHKILLLILSGTLLGIAIYTKITAAIMIPLIAYLIYTGLDGNRIKHVMHIMLWLSPVILIPLHWPLHSIMLNQFDLWVSGVTWQASRGSNGLVSSLGSVVLLDPIILILGLGGLVYTVYTKDHLIVLWIIPFFIFFSIAYNQYFHWILVFPALSISSARMLVELYNRINSFTLKKFARACIYMVLSSAMIFTTMLITTDVTSAQFKMLAFMARHLDNDSNDVTVLTNPAYVWILRHVLEYENIYDYRHVLFYNINTDKIILIADKHLKYDNDGDILQALYDRSVVWKTFEIEDRYSNITIYPYTNLYFNLDGSRIEVRFIEDLYRYNNLR